MKYLFFACILHFHFDILTANLNETNRLHSNSLQLQHVTAEISSITSIPATNNFLRSQTYDHALNFTKHVSPNFDKRCFYDVVHILRNLDSHWAAMLLDSYGKLPSGVLLGNFMWVGKYDECLEVYAPEDKNTTSGGFHGMYCAAEWNITLPKSLDIPLQHLPLRTGVCLPESCKNISFEAASSFKSIEHLLALSPIPRELTSVVQLTSLDCNFQNNKLSPYAILFLFSMSLYMFVVLIATLLTVTIYFRKHLLFGTTKPLVMNNIANFEANYSNFVNQLEQEECEDEQSLFHNIQNENVFKTPKYVYVLKGMVEDIAKFLKCFCLFSNASKILDTRSHKKQFPCIHGIRFISMTWIILGHTYVHNMDIFGNYVDLWKSVDNLAFQVIIQGTYSVDSFFLIGGFLLAYLYFEEAEGRQGKISWLKLCLHRFIRITPVYIVLIGFKTLIFKHLSSGPFWKDETSVASCEQYWWWNLLYINNFLSLNNMCISWSWYLANDMQFFIISTLVLYILWRWQNIGMSIFLCMLVGSWVITGYLSYTYNLIPLFAGVSEAKNYAEYYQRMLLTWDVIYSKPYCRISSHLIGIFLAFILFKNNKRKLNIPLGMLTLGWCIAAFCSISVVYGLYHVKINPTLFHVYNALSRTSFSLGVAWVMYCCITENGGFINKILSYKLWIPLSRLTFCAYIFHPLVMGWYFQSQKVSLYFTHANMVIYYFAFLILSYGIAFIVSITFEAPLINLEKFFREKSRQ